MSRRILTPEAEAERDDFERVHERRGCYCHISAPCGHCTHPGHPLALAEDETAWTWASWHDMLDDLTDKARAAVADTIEKAAKRHLQEMSALEAP